MSRVGRMPVKLPAAVKITQNGNALTVKGPKGELTQSFDPHLKITIDSAQLSVETPQAPGYDAMHGLTRALINNMVLGVTDGFKKNLEIEGVGYRAELQGKNLVLALGLSHTVTVEPAAGISFVVDKTQRLLLIEGVDRQLVGETAAKIRSLRPPEPYKGKGIRYQGEVIRRKEGKKVAGTTGTA